MPKNTPLGFLIAAGAFVVGFAIIWHILWLGVLGLLAAIVLLVAFTTDDETEYRLPAAEVERIELATAEKRGTV